MGVQDEWENLYVRLSEPVAVQIRGISEKEKAGLEEIRARVNRPLEIVTDRGSRFLGFTPDDAAMKELVAALSGYALYSCEMQMANGYIPLPDGHRAGVCGRMTRQEDGLRMTEISSVCIRLARYIEGAGKGVYDHLVSEDGRAQSILLLGIPGCGKTTVLKDCALRLSQICGMHVAVVDERMEMTGILDRGIRLDMLSGAPKAEAFVMLIRSMAPQVLVTDEIGKEEDAAAILDAARCGVGILASAHAQNMDDLKGRPVLDALVRAGVFDRYILLGRHGSVLEIYDRWGNCIEKDWKEKKRAEVGYSGDGHDAFKHNRISAL